MNAKIIGLGLLVLVLCISGAFAVMTYMNANNDQSQLPQPTETTMTIEQDLAQATLNMETCATTPNESVTLSLRNTGSRTITIGAATIYINTVVQVTVAWESDSEYLLSGTVETAHYGLQTKTWTFWCAN